jgi:rhamnosyltransferase
VRVSVVIRAKNEARWIGESLDAVFGQRLDGDFEVVLVDSGSTDGTLEIVRRFPSHLIEIAPESFTYGRALNIGIEAARGEFIASISAHSTPADDTWLGNLLEPFGDPSVAGVYGRQLPRDNATLMELLGMRLSGVMDDRARRHTRNPMFSNANGAYRRALCLATAFDEEVWGAEDLAWARAMLRVGYEISYQPTAAVYHSHGEPFLRHVRRTLRDQPTFLRSMLGVGGGQGDRRPSLRALLFPGGR